jgi:RNA methyltransferase, TrmH family
MPFKVIESKENKSYKELVRLKKGDAKEGRFLIEGEDLVAEAHKEGKLESLIVPDGTSMPMIDYPIYGLKQGLYRELSSYQSLPKVMGIAKMKMASPDGLGDRVIYLDGVQDPGNVGTIIRTALSFSYTGVMLSNDSVSLYNSKVIQSTKGAMFHLPIARGDLSLLSDLGYHIYLTTLDGVDERNLASLESPSVLVFGNEGRGVNPKNMALGKKIKIVMNGIDSLNVGVAAGIFMYRFKKD